MTDIHQWSSEEVIKFWDYESKFPNNYWSYQYGKSLVRKFRSLLSSKKTICDFGCGDGVLIKHIIQLCDNYSHVYGFDTSLKSIKAANNKFENFKSFKGCYSDLAKLRSAAQTGFDLIFCCEVIEHVYDDALANILTDIKSLMTSNQSHLVISTPNNEDLTSQYILNPVTGTLFHRWQHVRTWDKNSLNKLLNNYGFKDIKIGECSLDSINLSHMSIIKRLIRQSKPVNLIATASI